MHHSIGYLTPCHDTLVDPLVKASSSHHKHCIMSWSRRKNPGVKLLPFRAGFEEAILLVSYLASWPKAAYLQNTHTYEHGRRSHLSKRRY